MRKFRFGLQALLRVREIREQQRRRVVGELTSIARAQEGRIEALGTRELAEAGGIAQAAGSGRLDMGRVRGHAAAAAALRGAACREGVALEATRERVAQEMPLLARAAAERRAIERLREARLDEWRRDVMRDEQREMDDRARRARAEGVDA